MSFVQWTEKTTAVLRNGGVIGPEERLAPRDQEMETARFGDLVDDREPERGVELSGRGRR